MGIPPLLTFLLLPQRIGDGRSQPGQPVFEQVVHHPLLQRFHRPLLANRTRDEDERDVESPLDHKVEGKQTVKLGQVVIGQNQIEIGCERGQKVRFGLHTLPDGIKAGPLDFVYRQFGIEGIVFQDQ